MTGDAFLLFASIFQRCDRLATRPAFMPSLETLEKSTDQSTSPPQKRRWGWLIAPLMGISFVLHLGLLFVPLPAQEPVEEEIEEKEELQEEEPEILSLSTVESPPEPIDPPPPEQPQTQNETPPPSGEPPPPRPEDVENIDALALQEDDLENDDFLDENAPPVAFDPGRQQALLGSARQYLDQSEFGSINSSDPGLVAASLASGWPGYIDQGCFFESFEPVIQPTTNAADAMFFTRNLGLVRDDELPSLVEGELFQHGDYCDAEFYEVLEDGVPVLFLSLIGIGAGNPPGSAVVVFWDSDPR